jgi:hypothetical protein
MELLVLLEQNYLNNKKFLIYGIDKVSPGFRINNNNFYKVDLNNS